MEYFAYYMINLGTSCWGKATCNRYNQVFHVGIPDQSLISCL